MEKFPDIPGYIIEKKLGRGRCMDSYLAIVEESEQRVVIRVLLPELVQDETFGKRFLYEARKAAKLEHENIAKILDVGETSEFYYFVMELFLESLRSRLSARKQSSGTALQVESHTLGDEEEETDKFDPHEILDTLRQLLDAVDYANQEEAIHRDIRPDNIFFKEDGTPVIADYYISRIVASSDILRQKGIKAHTPHYASPEQVLKKSLDISSDIYSLGVTLYEMLTGTVPFDADTPIAIENQHIMEAIPLLPDHLSAFQPLVDNMMAKTLEERAKSGAELILLMEEISENLMQPHIEESPVVTEPAVESVETPHAHEDLVDLNINVELAEAFGNEIQARTGELPDLPPPVEPLEMPTEESYAMPPEEPLEMPTAGEERSPMLAMEEEPPKRLQFLENLPEILRNPKILIAGGAAIVIIVTALIFLLPSGETEPSEKSASKENQKVLTPEEQQEQDFAYTRKFRAAQRDFGAGNYPKALEQITAAENIKTTKESQELRAQIEAKMTGSKDDQAFQKASETNTIAGFQEYLDNYASGAHVKEAKKKITELQVLEKKLEKERKKWASLRITLRSQYKTLTVKETREMTVKYGFFEKYYNKNGNFRNFYEALTTNDVTVIVDNATGLIWHQGGSTDYMDYVSVKKWLEKLNNERYAGYSDWRLPTLEEALSLLEKNENSDGLFIDSIFSKEQKYIWTGDNFDEEKVWAVDLFGGDANRVPLTQEAFVRPVRSLDKTP